MISSNTAFFTQTASKIIFQLILNIFESVIVNQRLTVEKISISQCLEGTYFIFLYLYRLRFLLKKKIMFLFVIKLFKHAPLSVIYRHGSALKPFRSSL